jgi:hypothetical protein
MASPGKTPSKEPCPTQVFDWKEKVNEAGSAMMSLTGAGSWVESLTASFFELKAAIV